MSRYIISDLHIGHNNIQNFRKGLYETSEEHWEAALEGIRSIPKRATLFLLGDIAFTKEHLEAVSKISCRNKVLVVGNHDLHRKTTNMKDLVGAYDQVYALHKYKDYWMQHSPIHTQELRGKRCLHGHTHYELMKDDCGIDREYTNCCVEYTGYKPITFEYATSEEYQQECKKKYLEYSKFGLV